MATEPSIQQLEEKHQELEDKLENLMAHPGATDAEIAETKREKLHLKDQIAQLSDAA